MARKTKTGKWQGVVRKKGHKTYTKVFTKKTLADRWERKKLEELEQQIISPKAAHGVLLSGLIDWYLREFTPRKRAHVSERNHLRLVQRYFKDTMTEELTPDSIIEYVDYRLESVVSDTVRKDLTKLSVVLTAGMAMKKIPVTPNPVTIAREVLSITDTLKPGNKRTRRPDKWELKALYKSRLGLLVEFAIETAMRRGEIAKMRLCERDGNTLNIPKTKTNIPRTIPLTPRACKILDSLDVRPDVPAWGLSAVRMTQVFQDICKENGIEDLRLHDMRHEGTSRFFEQGWPIEKVAMITGHGDWRSLKIYTNLSPANLAKEMHEKPLLKLVS